MFSGFDWEELSRVSHSMMDPSREPEAKTAEEYKKELVIEEFLRMY